MPWVTIARGVSGTQGAGKKICPFRLSPAAVEHDACDFDLLQSLETGPRRGMRALLERVKAEEMDPRVRKFLFCETWGEATSREVFHPVLRLAFAEKTLVLPDPAHSWYPFCWETGRRVPFRAGPPQRPPSEQYTVYAALAMRIAILTAYCGNLHEAERKYDEEHRTVARSKFGAAEGARGRPSKASRGSYQATGDSVDDSSLSTHKVAGPLANDPASSETASGGSGSSGAGDGRSFKSKNPRGRGVCEVALLRLAGHFANLCLDSHWLLACVFDNAGSCLPRDDGHVLRAALPKLAPGDGTVFHEGEMPLLDRRVMRCTFFGGAAFPAGSAAGVSVASSGASGRSEDPVVHMLSKSIPHRCEVREMVGIIENGCVADEGAFNLLQTMLAGSLLGVYRHARSRPGSFARHALYDLFFWHPGAPLAEALVAHKMLAPRKDGLLCDALDRETLGEAFRRRQGVTLHAMLTGGKARRPTQAPLSGAAAKAVADTVPKRYRVSHDDFSARLAEHRMELVGAGSGGRNGRTGSARRSGNGITKDTLQKLRQHAAFPIAPALKRAAGGDKDAARELGELEKEHLSGGNGEAGDLLAARRSLLFHWLTTTSCHAGGASGKGAAKKGKPQGERGGRKKIHKKEAFQDTMFIVVREFLIFQLRFLPHLRDVLCEKTEWEEWERAVVDGVDVLRDLTYSRHMETVHGGAPILPAAFAGFEVPENFRGVAVPEILLHSADLERVRHQITNTLFEPHKPHVFDVFLHVYRTMFLDALGGSEMPADAFLSPETEQVLWYAVVQGAWPAHCELVARRGVPETQGDAEAWQRNGHFPLQFWHVKGHVIERFLRVQRAFQVDAKRDLIVQFLRETAQSDGMYQVQVLAAFTQACVDRVRVRCVPLPGNIAKVQAHALRQRFALQKNDPLPRHTLSNFVCRRCRRFCGTLVREKARKLGVPSGGRGQGKDGYVTWETASGGENVLFAVECVDTRAKRAIAATGHGVADFGDMRCPEEVSLLTIFQKAAVLPVNDVEDGDGAPEKAIGEAVEDLEDVAAQPGEDLPMFGALASDACMPTDPVLDTAPGETRIAAAKLWLDEQKKREHAASAAFRETLERCVLQGQRRGGEVLENACLSPEEIARRLRAASSVVLPGHSTPFQFDLRQEEAVDQVELHFLQKWQGNLLVGNFPPKPARGEAREEQVLWTCGSKQASTEHKKLKSVSKRHAAAVASGKKEAVEKEAGKLRRILRTRYEHSLCHETQLLEVDLLGNILRLDGAFIVACCRCLGFTEFSQAAWRGESIVCPRCDSSLRALQLAGESDTGMMAGKGSGVFVCRKCNRTQRLGQKYESLLVYDDISAGSERFVTVHFCPQHVANAAWAWGAPNVLPLSALDRGLNGKWRTLSKWNATQDYLRAYIFEKPDAETGGKQKGPTGSKKKRARKEKEEEGEGGVRKKRAVGRPRKSDSAKGGGKK